MRVVLFSALAVLGSACGVDEDEAVVLKEGETLEGSDYCGSFGCENPLEFCAELFFDFGRSPALCVPDTICDRLDCAKEGRICAVFDGFPGQVKCID
ncbi:hypothetical protein [Pyxidicoccus xibeiensis]|uniref:hypothetical protein n=1 Tax=Pyxidicoccus xibeiensis TaxID=2906759 RepID=UPI0020A6FF31|nr:hypothetical protein [Pyxidicoccus xibeiensis]MCP3139196.1 hypothetical protein [Pyxidicoccus xibeiensis]